MTLSYVLLAGPRDRAEADTFLRALSRQDATAASSAVSWSEADREVVARVRAGDERAFEALFTQHAPRLAAYAAGFVHSRMSAEDLVQDVFLRVWAQRASWDVRTTVSAYLHTAVRSRALDHLKRERVSARTTTSALSESTERPARPDDIVERDEEAARVQAALATLSDRVREAMALRWHGGLSYAEIASVMGISVRTVENQLAAGLRHLRARLDDRGPASPSD